MVMVWQVRLAARLVGSVGSLLYLALPNGCKGRVIFCGWVGGSGWGYLWVSITFSPKWKSEWG